MRLETSRLRLERMNDFRCFHLRWVGGDKCEGEGKRSKAQSRGTRAGAWARHGGDNGGEQRPLGAEGEDERAGRERLRIKSSTRPPRTRTAQNLIRLHPGSAITPI